jgi:RES domain-containing protein
MRAWRLCKRKWAATAFSGNGAAEAPGRWNSQGQKAVYCAETQSLAMLEILAHVGNKRHLQRAKFVAIPVDIPDALIAFPSKLPSDWRRRPPSRSTQQFGDRALDHPDHPVLRVPSAIIPGEFCFVLRPDHPRFVEIRIGAPEPVEFDPRVVSV